MAGTAQGSPKVAAVAVSVVALLAALSGVPANAVPTHAVPTDRATASQRAGSWTTVFDGGGHQIDAAAAVTTDPAGDVFAGA